jgi:hypothetical protein
MGRTLACAVVVSLLGPVPANAQIYESVGIRAQGMGGAFVAIADDADAAWWNPAGLAGGAYFSALVEYGTAQDPKSATDASGAALPSWRDRTRGFTVAFPALGLSYYRLQVSQIRPFGATDANGVDRQDRGGAPVSLSSLLLQQFGATVGESIGGHVVIGSTVRIVRGRFGVGTGASADASLDRAAAIEGPAQTHADLDIGAIANFGRLRIGAAVKHLTEPSFSASAVDRVELSRQARAGVSVSAPGGPAFGPLTLAMDADLTRTATAVGDVRHIAGGAEAWLLGRRVALRGGITANTLDAARPSGSAGASVAIRSGLYVDGQLTRGSDRTVKGWGFALRVTY